MVHRDEITCYNSNPDPNINPNTNTRFVHDINMKHTGRAGKKTERKTFTSSTRETCVTINNTSSNVNKSGKPNSLLQITRHVQKFTHQF